uniref:Uncharacterized protein n=1 Tax=mine drainage metagenome TaxID=410659 RepID=E6QH52_9ZZZZ
MGIRYLAHSKPHGQELLAHIKLATSFLAIYIGPLTRFSVPLDLRGHFVEVTVSSRKTSKQRRIDDLVQMLGETDPSS